MEGARHVGGAVAVLPSRVAEVHRLALEHGALLVARLVVDDGSVFPGARDGLEGVADVALHARAAPAYLVGGFGLCEGAAGLQKVPAVLCKTCRDAM